MDVPTFGTLNDPPAIFCLQLKDTIELAVKMGNNAKVWIKKIKEGKCGRFPISFVFSALLAETHVLNVPTYILEMKLQLKGSYLGGQDGWPVVYAYASFLPKGLYWATWRPEYGKNPEAVQRWFRDATVMPRAVPRLGIAKCCNQAERLMTKFVALPGHQYMYYPDPTCTWKGCKLLPIPDDIVHEEEIHADNPAEDSLPEFDAMRAEGILFIYMGKPSCFWAPKESGI